MPQSVIGAGWNGYVISICLPLGVLGKDHEHNRLASSEENLPYLRLVRFKMGTPAAVFEAQVQHYCKFHVL